MPNLYKQLIRILRIQRGSFFKEIERMHAVYGNSTLIVALLRVPSDLAF